MSAAGSCSRSAATSPPPAPTTRGGQRVAARREDIDTTLRRAVAKARLEALLGAAAPAPAGKARRQPPGGPRKVALIVGNGAYQNVAPLANPPRDARLIASTFAISALPR
jgi:hypothetical protein